MFTKIAASLLLFTLAYTPHKALALDNVVQVAALDTDNDDSYDPFADYSEFDESADEEADINFFKNGRFFTISFAFGSRGFTGNLSQMYSQNSIYSFAFTYFMDLRLAVQFTYTTGDHGLSFYVKESPATQITGNVSFAANALSIKYFFNTENVTRGLADLNPYTMFGMSQNYRTISIAGQDGFGRDSAMGLDFGGGLEVPVLRKKGYVGIQGLYHYVDFRDRNTPFSVSGNGHSMLNPSGDMYDVQMILGLNF